MKLPSPLAEKGGGKPKHLSSLTFPLSATINIVLQGRLYKKQLLAPNTSNFQEFWHALA